MNNKKDNKVIIDESFLEQISAVYPSVEQGVNSCVAMWSNIKKHNQSYIPCSLKKNECMYMVEFLAKLKNSINLKNECDALIEIEEFMICGVLPSDKELELKWGCDLISAENGFSNIGQVCQYIIVEWAIMYREFNSDQKKAFEKYIDELYKD